MVTFVMKNDEQWDPPGPAIPLWDTYWISTPQTCTLSHHAIPPWSSLTIVRGALRPPGELPGDRSKFPNSPQDSRPKSFRCAIQWRMEWAVACTQPTKSSCGRTSPLSSWSPPLFVADTRNLRLFVTFWNASLHASLFHHSQAKSSPIDSQTMSLSTAEKDFSVSSKSSLVTLSYRPAQRFLLPLFKASFHLFDHQILEI